MYRMCVLVQFVLCIEYSCTDSTIIAETVGKMDGFKMIEHVGLLSKNLGTQMTVVLGGQRVTDGVWSVVGVKI